MKRLFLFILLALIGCHGEEINVCKPTDYTMSLTLSKSNPFGFNITINSEALEVVNEIDCGVNEGYAGEIIYNADDITFYFESTTGGDVIFKLIDCDTGTEYVNKTLTITQTDGIVDKYYVQETIPAGAYGKKVKIQITSADTDFIDGNSLGSLTTELLDVTNNIVDMVYINGYEYVLCENNGSTKVFRRPFGGITNDDYTEILDKGNFGSPTAIGARGNKFIIVDDGSGNQASQSIGYSTNEFESFQESSGTSNYSYSDIIFLSSSRLFAVSNDGDNHKYSEDGGIVWSDAGGTGGVYSKAAAVDDTNVVSMLYSATNSSIELGAYNDPSPTSVLTATNVQLNDIKMLSSLVGYSVGYNISSNRGVIYKTVNGGTTWSLNYTTSSDVELYNVFFTDNYVIASGESTFISDDAAATWNENSNVATERNAILYDQYILTKLSTSNVAYTTRLYNIGSSFSATSEIIEVRNDEDCTRQIVYSNDTRFDGIDYGNIAGLTMQLRIPAQLWKRAWEEEQESFEKSNGEFVRAFNQKITKRKLEIGYIPNYMHNIINRVLMHDNITIDGVDFIKRDEYEHENINRYNLSKAAVWLTEKDTILKNVL